MPRVKLLNFISKGSLIDELKAVDKKAALKELVDLLKHRHDGFKSTEALDALLKREKFGSTGIGQGVAVPHAKLQNLKSVIGAFGRSKTGIDFAATDGEPVYFVFLLLSPFDQADVHMDSLRCIAEAVKRPNFLNFARQAKGVKDLLELFQEMDQQP
ncbi:MAG: PTS sugar transporter subunit IIA [Planctomycetes bacterium]|nr:PTS sugar transporter subunit IIA [Planctomycetota bacterium]